MWPHFVASKSFLLLSVALIGTTITPYIQLYEAGAVVDKGVKPSEYRFQRVDAITGAVLAAFVAMSIIVATGATIGGTGPLTSASTAAKGLQPVAGAFATTLFGLGRPPRGLRPGGGRGAAVDLVRRGRGDRRRTLGLVELPPGPGLPGHLHLPDRRRKRPWCSCRADTRITLILNTQVLEGVITPMTLILILILANRRSLLGSAANGTFARTVGGLAIVAVAAVASVYVVLTVLGWFGVG